VLGGASAGNYSFTAPTGLVASITPKALTLSGTTVVADKVYDGTTAAALSGGVLQGVVSGDTVTLTQSGVFANKEAGAGKAVTASGVLGGASAGNYSFTAPTGLVGSITPKALTLSGTTVVADKVYDGTTTAGVSGSVLQGVLSGDTVTLGGVFADRSAGTGKAVTALLGGASAGNYSFTAPTGLVASITPKALTVSPTTVVANKVYDGTTTASLSGEQLGGLLGGDSVTLVGAFADQFAGIGKAVKVSLGGASAGNYSISQPTGLTADVTIAHGKGIDQVLATRQMQLSQPVSVSIYSPLGVATVRADVTRLPLTVANVVGTTPDVEATFNRTDNLLLVSSPSANEPTTMVTLGDAQKMLAPSAPVATGAGTATARADVRVPVSRNSLASIVNGGLNLPEGIQQQLFMVKR